MSQNNNKGTQTRQAEELLSIHRRSPEKAALNKPPWPTAVKPTAAEKNPLGPHSYPTCIFQEGKQVSHSSEVANRDFQFPVRAMQQEKWDVGLVSSPSPHPTASKPPGSFPATLQGQHCPWASSTADGKTSTLSSSLVNASSVSASNAYSPNNLIKRITCEGSASLMYGLGFPVHILRPRLFIAAGKFSDPQLYRREKQRPEEAS